MYVGPGDDNLPQALWDNLIGLLYFRQTGTDESFHNMRLLGRHLKGKLGKDVPMFAVSSDIEDDHRIMLWRNTTPVNLVHPDYNLRVVPPLEDDSSAYDDERNG